VAVEDTAPARLARRFVDRQNLCPPIDVESLVNERANLILADIPLSGVDGITLDLKVPGRQTRVILNSNLPSLRRRFTLAHELGHILIPWHAGNIVDTANPNSLEHLFAYYDIEMEANQFASEVLIPQLWLESNILPNEDLAMSHLKISEMCEVSGEAAAIRLIQNVQKNVVFAATREGTVEYSGRSLGTFAKPLERGSQLGESAFDYCTKHFATSHHGRDLHWWILPSEIALKDDNGESWRKILERILDSMNESAETRSKMAQRINGVVGYAHSRAKRETSYSPESVANACIQSFRDRPEYENVVAHPEFEVFVSSRAKSFFDGQS